MKAVIFAAGRGNRMGASTKETPKPLHKIYSTKYGWITLIEHKVKQFPDDITEIVLVVGYLKDRIIAELGEFYDGRRVHYVHQTELKGTAHGLFLCQSLLKDESNFLVMAGDDLYCRADFYAIMQYTPSVLITEHLNVKGKGVIEFDANGEIERIVENCPDERSGYVNASLYNLTPSIFRYSMVSIGNNEYGLPQTLLAHQDEIRMKAVKSQNWIQITTAEDLNRVVDF